MRPLSEIVDPDASDTSMLLPMLDPKVVIAGLFECRIKDRGVCIEGGFEGFVEVGEVGRVGVGRSEVGYEAEPPSQRLLLWWR